MYNTSRRGGQDGRYKQGCIFVLEILLKRCFSLWKQQFRCLRGIYGNIETARKTIVACAVLHNIAIDMKEGLFPDEVLNEPPSRFNESARQPNTVNTVRGNIKRRHFIENNF